MSQNPWIKAQLKIWDMLRREHKLEYIKLAWCAYDCEFKPDKIVYRVKSWPAKGITTATTDLLIYTKGKLKGFERLTSLYNMTSKNITFSVSSRCAITLIIPLKIEHSISIHFFFYICCSTVSILPKNVKLQSFHIYTNHCC